MGLIRNEAASQATPAHRALRSFAAAVAGKRAQLTAGEPEEQLRTPFENLMSALGAAWGLPVVCTGEAPLPDRLGRPDFAVHNNGLLAGYVELKAPGTGADASRFKGRNKSQFKRFAAASPLPPPQGAPCPPQQKPVQALRGGAQHPLQRRRRMGPVPRRQAHRRPGAPVREHRRRWRPSRRRIGPYAVSELRISRALGDRGATLPKDGTHIYLTDTLESPHAAPPQTPLCSPSPNSTARPWR